MPIPDRVWTRSGRPYAWNSRLGVGHEENGRLTAEQGRKFINPGGILLPEKAKGDGRGFSNNACPGISSPLKPVAGLEADALLGMTEASYIELVQWTGEQPRPDKRGVLKKSTEGERAAPGDIWLVAKHPKEWVRQVHGTESVYYRAVGSAEALMAKAEALGQAWMKGVASEVARMILRERPT